MCDAWMPVLKLRLTQEQFHQLPRNPAYKYEFSDGEVCLTPRAKHYHAWLDLRSFPTENPEPRRPVDIRPIQESDWQELERVFQATLCRVQPFASLDADTMAQASRECLARTRTGQDGVRLPEASWLAASAQESEIVGAILITLVPGGDPCDPDSYYWRDSGLAELPAGEKAQPHLTWIFVAPENAGWGIGSALLAASVRVLRERGFTQLWSTFVSGNDSSMLWHWRNGFQLLPHPNSRRRWPRLWP
jgi:GNAT superfamily N-acetyltransferase